MPPIQPFTSDAPLFYNVGIWGDRGYGIPNFGKNEAGQTVNRTIEKFVTEGGRRLSIIMHQQDAGLVDPPRMNTITKMIALINRARVILVGESIKEAEPALEGSKISGGRVPLKVFPCPYFKCDNRLMFDFATSCFAALGELLQSSENMLNVDITESLAQTALKYLQRFQRDMAMEYFGMDKAAASDPNLDLSKTLDRYAPRANGFVSGAAYDDIDTISFPDEVDLGPLAKGLLIMDLPVLGPYPYSDTGATPPATGSTGGAATSATTTVPPFPTNPTFGL